MKKLIPIVAFLAIVGFVSQAGAATDDTCGMSVTVSVNVSVSVTNEPLAFGTVAYDTSDVSDSACTVTNNGSAQNDYRLAVTATPSAWTTVTASPPLGWNYIRLLALFTSQTSLSTTDFAEADDIVAGSETAADEDTYAITTDGVSFKGYDCTMTAVRKLWFRFDAPSGTELTGPQWITVTVYAYQG